MSRRGRPTTEIDFERERDYYPNGRERDYEEIDIKRRREPEFLREDYGRTASGPLVLRERKTEDYEFRTREKPRVREREIDREEIIVRRGERDRPRERDVEREELIYRPRERERERPMKREVEREEIIYRNREPERAPREPSYEKEEIVLRRGERDRPRTPAYDKEELVVRHSERDRSRARAYEKDEIVVRRGERERPRERDYEKEEIIIRRTEKEPEPEPEPEPVPEPEPIRAPPIHQEIITHHRHIDHGFERQPAPPPPRRKSPSPEPSFEEIEIRRRGTRHGQAYDDDIIFEREVGRKKAQDERTNRRRSLSNRRSYPREELDIVEEADYYNRRVSDRSYMGEAYNGATRDWAIVDVPPGTKRVTMDGIGGGSQEITWQRYNGVRRSRFITDGEEYSEEVADRGRRFVGVKPKQDNMWTEITKDLVVKEAIEMSGLDYEETEYFFYVMDYLRYEDVLELVELSEDIRSERRDRIRQIQWERERLNDRRERRPWDAERVVEREVIYEGRRPGRYLM